MGSLVEDLLLLARLDQSREMESKPVDLKNVVSDAVASAKAAGPHHKVSFSAPEEDFYILGDVDRIHQVVANLLANARAHTPEGTLIDVKLSQTPEGISLSISDNGPGIAPHILRNGFDLFQTTKIEGMGVGLWLSRSVMENHNGFLTATNKPDGGAEFRLTFLNSQVV